MLTCTHPCCSKSMRAHIWTRSTDVRCWTENWARMNMSHGHSLILWAFFPLMLLELIKPCTKLVSSVWSMQEARFNGPLRAICVFAFNLNMFTTQGAHTAQTGSLTLIHLHYNAMNWFPNSLENNISTWDSSLIILKSQRINTVYDPTPTDFHYTVPFHSKNDWLM